MPGPKTRWAAAKKLSDVEVDLMSLYGYAAGSRAHAPGESGEDFAERLRHQVKEVLVAVEGSELATAAVFNTTPLVIETLIAGFDDVMEARNEGLAIRESRATESRDAVVVIKDLALKRLKEERHPVTHNFDWPDDPEMFHVELMEILPQAIRDYNGSIMQIQNALSLHQDRIEPVIAANKSLKEMQRVCLGGPIAEGERNVEQQIATGRIPEVLRFLAARYPEVYGNKQDINFKNVGFEPPPTGPVPNALFDTPNDKEKE